MHRANYARSMDSLVQVPFLGLSVFLLSSALASSDADGKLTPMPRLIVYEGEQTSLPCPIDMMSQEPVSAIWFRVATGSPHTRYTRHKAVKVYALVAPSPPSVTLMGRSSLFDGEHWKQHSWKRKAFFSLLSDPPALLLNRLERFDTGSYVCNVTYRGENVAITVTEARAELFVAVPQPPPVITDSRGIVSNSTTGPYTEGDIVRLTCVVSAVSHKVTLVWMHSDETLNTPLGTVATPSGGWATTIELGPLRREHLQWNVSCLVTSDLSLPIESWVLLDMFLAPTNISLWSWPYGEGETSGWVMAAPIAGEAAATSAGASSLSSAHSKTSASSGGFYVPTYPLSALNAERETAGALYVPRIFECEVTGSHPHSNVTWFLDGRPLNDHLIRNRDEDNVTKSVLLLPALEHAGKLLECRATNNHLPKGRHVFTRYMEVDLSDKPEVNLKLGAGLNASHITEGTDVYMECSVQAPSRVGDITWLHEGQELKAAPNTGTLITSRYLVMRRVNPSQSGSYSCRVNGTTGVSVESSLFYLRVKYSPKCDPDEERMLHVERNVAINVTCNVKADPNEGLHYFWLLENRTHVPDTPRKYRQVTRRKQSSRPLMTTSSYLEVVANASLFDAVLACWAVNAVGTQTKRCRLKFTHKGEHSSGLTCTVGNYTDTSFSMLCSMPPAANGTIPRQLLVEVFDAGSQNKSERNLRAPDLGFPISVTGLRPSTDYLVVVRLPPDATFRTYVRTLGLAQTLKGRDDLKRSPQPGRWNTTLSIIVLTCTVAAALVALLGIYVAHTFKERWKKPRRSSCDHDRSVKARDPDALYIRDHKSHVAAAEYC